jgi:hypothetical protein
MRNYAVWISGNMAWKPTAVSRSSLPNKIVKRRIS